MPVVFSVHVELETALRVQFFSLQSTPWRRTSSLHLWPGSHSQVLFPLLLFSHSYWGWKKHTIRNQTNKKNRRNRVLSTWFSGTDKSKRAVLGIFLCLFLTCCHFNVLDVHLVVCHIKVQLRTDIFNRTSVYYQFCVIHLRWVLWNVQRETETLIDA